MSARRKTISSQMYQDSEQTSQSNTKVALKAIQSVKHRGKHYVFEKKLGKGVQSTVWLFRLEGDKYAGKITSQDWIYEERKGEPEYWKKRMLSLCREIVFLSMIDSPYVIKQYEVIKTKTNYYSILEFSNGGALQDLLNIHGRFTEKFAIECLR